MLIIHILTNNIYPRSPYKAQNLIFVLCSKPSARLNSTSIYMMCALSLNVIFKLLNKTFNKQTARLCLHYPSVLHCDSTLLCWPCICTGTPACTAIAISKVSQLLRRSIMCVALCDLMI